MITKIRKWFFQRYYARQFEKEAWVHLCDAGLAREELNRMTDFYNNSIKETKDKRKKIDELIEQTKKPESVGEIYNNLRSDIDMLQEEIKASEERDKDFVEKGSKKKKIEIAQKQFNAKQAMEKAKIIRNLKITSV